MSATVVSDMNTRIHAALARARAARCATPALTLPDEGKTSHSLSVPSEQRVAPQYSFPEAQLASTGVVVDEGNLAKLLHPAKAECIR